LVKGIFKILYRIEVEGIDNIPKEGRAILCANHISNLDPIVLGIICPRPISFMAKKELFSNKLLSKLFYSLNAFPVDRQSSDISAIRKSLEVLRGERLLGIFPEGTRITNIDINSAKPGISMIGIKSKSPIIPIFIDSKYKLFSKIKVNVGKPIHLDSYYDKKLRTEDYKEISVNILKSIYSLKKD
jgi:1-acyl-sn-glycerol-3-phosphate acyltransferase